MGPRVTSTFLVSFGPLPCTALSASTFNNNITNQRPFNILFNKINHEYIPKLLQQVQEKMLHLHDKDRQNKNYHVGEVTYEKNTGKETSLILDIKNKNLRKISLIKFL